MQMMPFDLAKRIAADYCGSTIGEYQVETLHQVGGTSVILIGKSNGEPVAIKVYAKELFEGEGGQQAAAELERIGRQISLKDHTHPNIVRTHAAGRCDRLGYHYVVMDYVADPTLEEFLGDLPRDRIRFVIQQVAKAVLFLHETLNHVHRDIKPPNIAIRRKTFHATVLDLGLIRPIEGDTITDQGGRVFLGTKRYAAPEYLDGTLIRNPTGWLAVSFYQLGAVLHDVVMRQRLFEGLDGEDLKRAVLHDVPRIDASDVSPEILQLTRDCLLKDPQRRFDIVSWARFLSEPTLGDSSASIQRLRNSIERLAPAQHSSPTFPEGAMEQHLRTKAMQNLTRDITYHLQSYLANNEGLFPRPIVTSIAASSTSQLFKIAMSFQRSGSALDVTTFVICELQDVASQLCRCMIISCPGEHNQLPADVTPLHLYSGSFVPAVFATHFEQEFPRSLANVLEIHT